MNICEYGCEREAKHQFKNGNWCCENHINKCPSYKLNLRIKHLGKKLSIEHKEKLSKSHLGKPSPMKGKNFSLESRKKMSKSHLGKPSPMKGKTYPKKFGEKISKSLKGKSTWNKGRIDLPKGHKHNEETRKKISNSKKGLKFSKLHKENLSKSSATKLTINKIKERYPLFYKIEKPRYNPDKPKEKEIQIHCKNHKCKNSKEQNGWFTPTRTQLSERIRNLENKNGNGAGYFYCSEECKQECSLFNKSAIQLIKEDQIRVGIIKEDQYTQEEYNIWRQEVLKRADFKCEYCGKDAEHCHHSKPQKLEPFFSLDPDYGIACCKVCHYKYGHQVECSTGQLANTLCI